METLTHLAVIKITLSILLWFTSSSLGNVLRKMVLTDFPLPVTVTMVHLLSSSLYLEPVCYFMGIQKTGNISKLYFLKIILPLALGKFLASVSSQISLLKVPVSYAHTVKATLPLFVVILSRLILKEKQTLPVYLSLLPIIGGVMIASATELGFNLVGLIAALVATLGFSLQNIFSKKCLEDTGYHHLHLLILLSRIAALSFLPVWLLLDARRFLFGFDDVVGGEWKMKIFILLFFDGFFNMLQNVFAFTVLSMVTSLSYSVANASKRLFIIGTSLLLLRNPVTFVNVLGMCTSVCGVLCYNKAKYDQRQKKKAEAMLPYFCDDSNGVLAENKANLIPNGTSNSVLITPPKEDSPVRTKVHGSLHSRSAHVV